MNVTDIAMLVLGYIMGKRLAGAHCECVYLCVSVCLNNTDCCHLLAERKRDIFSVFVGDS